MSNLFNRNFKLKTKTKKNWLHLPKQKPDVKKKNSPKTLPNSIHYPFTDFGSLKKGGGATCTIVLKALCKSNPSSLSV